jgi:hypothetical protein
LNKDGCGFGFRDKDLKSFFSKLLREVVVAELLDGGRDRHRFADGARGVGAASIGTYS